MLKVPNKSHFFSKLNGIFVSRTFKDLLRHLSIFLIFSYFSATLGLRVNQHFCCGKLVSMELLWGKKPKDCSGKVPIEPKKCCKDEVKILQADNGRQSFSDVQFEPSFSFVALIYSVPFYEPLSRDFENTLVNHLPNGPPPGIDSRHLFLLHRSFLI